tara:strand:- start:17569 stop:18618 length:1050 start_codon:yes stop_codon:yes gene_type:complete
MYQVIKRIKPLITNTGPKLSTSLNSKFFLKTKNFLNHLKLNSFGKKNKKKIFYVIQRSPGSGFFSNFVYVLNHLRIAIKFNFIPIIDMKNFKTIYNDKYNQKNKNAWNYYFKDINKYKLNDVYQSQNVIFSSNIIDKKFYFHLDEINDNLELQQEFRKIQKKYIRIHPKILKQANSFFSKYKKKKILGIHMRGTSYKNAPKHPFPIPVEMGIKLCNQLMKKYNYEKLFIITEEKKYLKQFKKNFGNNLIIYNSFRSELNDAFEVYPRKLHRYKLGLEILIECLIFSKCDGIVSNMTNVSSASIFLSKKRNQIFNFFLGYNSSNKFIASFLWHIKKSLPRRFFGFNLKIF